MHIFDKNQEILSFSFGSTQSPPNHKAKSSLSMNTRSKVKKLLTELPAKDNLDTTQCEMEKDNITYKVPRRKEPLEYAAISEEIQHSSNHDDEVTYDERDEKTKSKLA